MNKDTKFSRLQTIIGKEALDLLARSNVAIFGLGGVGSYAADALARSGIGAISIVDGDVYTISNINRQLSATHATIGKAKVDIVAQRILDINPECKVSKYNLFYTLQTADSFDFSQYNYIVDAIDTIFCKIELIKRAQAESIPIISCMGAGNRLQADAFVADDIYNTKVCPLAKAMRKLCTQNGIEKLKVIYSKEQPIKSGNANERIIGSAAFVTGTAGLMLAGEVIKELIGYKDVGC